MFTSISLRRLTYLMLLSILTVILVSACNSTSDTSMTSRKQSVEYCRIVQHVMGSSCIPRNPQRVVTLRLNTSVNSLALGIRPIASIHAKGYPIPKYLQGKLDQVEFVGGYGSPNLEKILYLQPDLILADSYYSRNFYDQLSRIAPTVVLNISFPPPSWKEQLKELASVLGKEEVGKQLIDQYWQRVGKLKQVLGDQRKTMKVSIANTSSEYGIWSYGEKHFSGSVLKDIGLQRPKFQQGDFFYIENLSKENLLDIDGDALFFVSWGRDDDQKTLEKLKRNPLWQHLRVVQQNHVYFVGMHWHSSDIFAINAILDDLEKYLVNTP